MRANPESSSKLNACLWIPALASLGQNDILENWCGQEDSNLHGLPR